ncbi:FAD-binding oxidoreductase [Kribbella turkmenica]|uniref:FAD-binding oxidoreductase n=1 Tax=Kribbella turkmenica TaxID=2530375 RepID=A0A4R4XGE6_9ACTN|nr:FAD-binding oxidoreductase [Kribbella turkmenica]TDD30011.1 FAD-binding oxidoreductase [Kribbella turkmenica]
MAHYDVGIVGAGVHGASAAFHMAKAGHRVVVYERAAPAGGPTGLSSAVCRAYYTNSFLAEVARDSLLAFSEFAALTDGEQADFRRTGALYVHPLDDVSVVDETVRALAAGGTRVEILTGQELVRLAPGLDLSDGSAVVWEPNAGYADPVATTQGLLAAARRSGAAVWSRTRVLSVSPGARVKVLHESGQDVVERLLVAAGPWTAGIMSSIGVELPLTVERHIVAQCGLPAQVTLPFVFVDMLGGYYVKPETGDQFLLGSLKPGPSADPDEPVAGVGDGEVAELAETFERRLSGVGNATLRGGWASLYDVSPDWQPVIGEVADQVYVNAGSSGHGFKLALAMGAHVARLVLGENPDPSLAQFHPDRFRCGGQPLVSRYGSARILG